MINKAFKIIDEKISESLIQKGFEKSNCTGESLSFIKNASGYKIVFDSDKKRFSLLEISIENGKETIEKTISVWLFDPNNDTEKEAKDIAMDFANTLSGENNKKAKRNVKKKKKNDEENNTSPLFLMNRIANIFPELKNEIQKEKDNYENFRGVTFAREKALPLVKETLTTGSPKDKFKKLCTVFSNLYDSGDLDTKGIITIVFLNAIEDQKSREAIEEMVGKDLKGAMSEAYKIRNKKIKPEKIKKKRTFISDTLETVQAEQRK